MPKKKSAAQLNREIAQALAPHQGRWDDSPGAWQRGYDFAKESALHETRAEQREVLRRVAEGARSAYDQGFVAGYQDALAGTRSHATKALAGAGSSSPFEEAKAEVALLEKEVDAANEVLKTFPRGTMGLTPDAVATTPEYRAAKARFQKAFARLRAFNAVYVKRFAKELRAERDIRYGRR